MPAVWRIWVNTGEEVRSTHPSSILSPPACLRPEFRRFRFLSPLFSLFFFQKKGGLAFLLLSSFTYRE